MDRRWFVVVAFVALAALVVVPAVAHAADLAGKVKSVDAAKKSAVVTDSAGKDHTVTWDEKTKVTVDGKDGKAADVKAGAKVTVTHEAGKASKIAVATK